MIPIDIYEDVLNIDQLENFGLSFLIYHDDATHTYFIKSLDFSVDSEGRTVEECKTNIQEAILIHLEDCEEYDTIFDPADKTYWEIFTDFKIHKEREQRYQIPKPIIFSEPAKILRGCLKNSPSGAICG